jgi:hypothetical protein
MWLGWIRLALNGWRIFDPFYKKWIVENTSYPFILKHTEAINGDILLLPTSVKWVILLLLIRRKQKERKMKSDSLLISRVTWGNVRVSLTPFSSIPKLTVRLCISYFPANWAVYFVQLRSTVRRGLWDTNFLGWATPTDDIWLRKSLFWSDRCRSIDLTLGSRDSFVCW